MPLTFAITHCDQNTNARCGLLSTDRGTVETPVFMPVGTAGAVKAMPQQWLEDLGAGIILANTYHLYLRPGEDVIRQFSGLHRFMGWDRLILTDSGGYQVLSHEALRKLTEDGVEFRSHLDGSAHFFTPEKAIAVQQTLGSDIIMAFDDCTRYPVTCHEAAESMRRSMRWAERCRKVHEDGRQTLFGIVQGGVFPELRAESLERLREIGFTGYALGGLSVGEPKALMYEIVSRVAPSMPESPRYVMGVGTPPDLIHCVKQGVDMFDCVLPTRNARNGTLYTSRGKISIKNARFRTDEGPLDPDCGCFVCRRYSRAYLRHLFVSGEITSSLFNTFHNLYFYLDLMGKLRQSIRLNSLLELERTFLQLYAAPD